MVSKICQEMNILHVQTGMEEEMEEGREAEEERQGDSSLKPVAPLNTFQGESTLQTAPGGPAGLSRAGLQAPSA